MATARTLLRPCAALPLLLCPSSWSLQLAVPLRTPSETAEEAVRAACDAITDDGASLDELARGIVMSELPTEPAARAAYLHGLTTDPACYMNIFAEPRPEYLLDVLGDACDACGVELHAAGGDYAPEAEALEPGALSFMATDASGTRFTPFADGYGGYETDGGVQDAGGEEHTVSLLGAVAAPQPKVMDAPPPPPLPLPPPPRALKTKRARAVRPAAHAARRSTQPSGGRYTPDKDAALRLLVPLFRVRISKKHANGIDWAGANRLVLSGDDLRFECLRRHVRNVASKVLRKRYLQYVAPDSQCNPARIWR